MKSSEPVFLKVEDNNFIKRAVRVNKELKKLYPDKEFCIMCLNKEMYDYATETNEPLCERCLKINNEEARWKK